MNPPLLDTRAVLRVVLIVLTVVGALALVWLLRKPISWLVLALFVAVAMSGPVNALCRHMRRGFAIATAYLTVALIPLAILALIVPSIVNGVSDLADKAPEYARQLQDRVHKSKKLRELDRKYGLTDEIDKQARKLPEKLGGAAGTLKDLGVGFVNSLFAGVTILILSLFMVGSGRRWVEAGLRSLPPDRAVPVRRALDHSAAAIGNYVAGVLVQATIAGVTTFVVLTILGVSFAAPLAVVMALLDIVPLVGATLGAIVIGIVTLFTDFPTATIVWVVWAIVYQQVENTVIQPRIQSRAVDVQPFVVLVSVLFGSTLFGVAGALLAIPLAATGQIAIREYLRFRRETGDGLLGPEGPDPASAVAGPV